MATAVLSHAQVSTLGSFSTRQAQLHRELIFSNADENIVDHANAKAVISVGANGSGAKTSAIELHSDTSNEIQVSVKGDLTVDGTLNYGGLSTAGTADFQSGIAVTGASDLTGAVNIKAPDGTANASVSQSGDITAPSFANSAANGSIDAGGHVRGTQATITGAAAVNSLDVNGMASVSNGGALSAYSLTTSGGSVEVRNAVGGAMATISDQGVINGVSATLSGAVSAAVVKLARQL